MKYEMVKNIWGKITEWCWDTIGWRVREFIRSTKNIIRWIPVIWKDRDWDDSFIFTILQTKLKNQAEYIRQRDFHTLAKRDSEIMMLCVRLIDKVKDEFYGMECHDYHKTEYDFIDCDTPGYKEMVFNEISENFDEYFKKYPLIYKKVIQKGSDNIFPIYDDGVLSKKRIAMNIGHINHIRVRKLLFKILEEQIERWWD
jgi:hypothetical protein